MKKFLFIILLGITSSLEAQEVMYHIFLRSFYDSNGDGQGDLKGLQIKLDYLQELGATSILLTPICKSEFYHNYFSSDFEKIDPEYGTIDDYLNLVKEVHKRKMKIYQDVEMQYVTQDHVWYKDSFGNPKSKYSKFIYYEDSLNLKPFFFYNVPEFTTYNDLKQKIAVVNMNTVAVREYTFDVLKYWADPNHDGKFDDGVDGFRFDHMMDDLDNFHKISSLFKNFWTPLISDLRKVNPDLTFIAEQANWFSLGREYFRDANIDRVFGFYLSWAIEKMNKLELTKAADSTLTKNPEGKNPIVFLENHDTRRIASVAGMTREKLKVAASLNLLLGGVPLIYYGQELGMKGKQAKGLTDGNDIPIREAYEWSADANGKGMALWYKNTGPWWDSTNVKPNDGISLEEERKDSTSLWHFYKKMIALRNAHPALYSGKYSVAENSNEGVLTFLRHIATEKILVAINLSSVTQEFRLNRDAGSGKNLVTKEQVLFDKQRSISIKPYDVTLYLLEP